MQQLADSSRETANNIQEISVEVTESVNLLADNANKMVDFISDVVMPDQSNTITKKRQDRTTMPTGQQQRLQRHLPRQWKA